jgi:hypothetical protein
MQRAAVPGVLLLVGAAFAHVANAGLASVGYSRVEQDRANVGRRLDDVRGVERLVG